MYKLAYSFHREREVLVYCLLKLLGASNACLNPILYGYLNENFRQEYRGVKKQFCQVPRLHSCGSFLKSHKELNRGAGFTERDTIAFTKNSCRNIYNKMPWHNNSISVSEVLPVAAAGSSDEPTETPGTSSGANGRLSKDVRLEAPNSSAAEVSRGRPRPVAIVFGMKRSPRMNRFRDGLTLGEEEEEEEVGLTREILLETKQNATEESSNTKVVLECEETSVPKQTSIGESMISGCLPPQPCVCGGSGSCQSVEEVMTLPIILQWKGDCFSSAPAPPARVKSEVFCGGTMKTFSSYSEDSLDVVLRETLV